MRKGAFVAGLLVLALWGWGASLLSPLLLPRLSRSGTLLETDWKTIAQAGCWTGVAALTGLAIALVVASALALLFLRYRWVQYALYPYAVVLQTLPVIAIAPLLVVWLGCGIWRVHRNLRNRMLLSSSHKPSLGPKHRTT